MSIKACAPHPSCQLPKVPSISAPRAAESPGAGVPVSAPRSSEQGSVPASCKRGHPGTGSQGPSWLWQPPSSVPQACRDTSRALPPHSAQDLGKHITCVQPLHVWVSGQGWRGLSLSPAHSTERAGAGAGEFHLCAQLTPHSMAPVPALVKDAWAGLCLSNADQAPGIAALISTLTPALAPWVGGWGTEHPAHGTLWCVGGNAPQQDWGRGGGWMQVLGCRAGSPQSQGAAREGMPGAGPALAWPQPHPCGASRVAEALKS